MYIGLCAFGDSERESIRAFYSQQEQALFPLSKEGKLQTAEGSLTDLETDGTENGQDFSVRMYPPYTVIGYSPLDCDIIRGEYLMCTNDRGTGFFACGEGDSVYQGSLPADLQDFCYPIGLRVNYVEGAEKMKRVKGRGLRLGRGR